MTLLACLGAVAAFLMFGLATDRHHVDRFGRHPTARRSAILRMVAWSTLATVFVACVAERGWVFGPVAWVALVMAGAAAAFMLLNLVPRPGEKAP